MKFNEKLMMLRKKSGLSQEELGAQLQVSRQTISKWELGESYPDFQKLILLSDYFQLTLDELIKDVDIQAVREANLNAQKLNSIYLDAENCKGYLSKIWRLACLVGVGILVFIGIAFVLHLFFPELEFLWRFY